jgi:hypothetical protein
MRHVGRFLCGLLILAALIGSARAHEQDAKGQNLTQILVTHADRAVTAGATVHYLSPNPNRVTALCYNVGISNGFRLGDASVSATQGVPIPPASSSTTPTAAMDATGDIYMFSTLGTTVGCTEVVRP